MSFIALSPQIFDCIQCKWRLMAPLAGSHLRSALANGLIAIEELLFAVHKAGCKRAAGFESAGDGFHFLLTKFASAPAGEYAIVLIHNPP